MLSSHHFAAALSTRESTEAALLETCGAVSATLHHHGQRLEGPASLVAAFFSPHHLAELEYAVELIAERLGTDNLIGCAAESILGIGREIEQQPAVALWAAALPAGTVDLVRLEAQQSPEGWAFLGFPESLEGPWPDDAALLLMADPFSFPADVLLERLNEDRPGVPVVGGIASAAQAPGENRLLLGRRVHRTGAVAAMLRGVPVRTLVSQGCRPIGSPLVITRAERNVVYELGGKPALAQLQEIFSRLPAGEQRLAREGLFLGRVVSEYRDRFEQGDFLVRGVVGIDPQQGAVAVADLVRVGQTVQFHIRDAATADAELRALLAAARQQTGAPPAAGLLFTCNGRGSRMFDAPSHDAACVAAAFGPIPLAGFFAAGEVGPVGRENFLHGFTASLALFG